MSEKPLPHWLASEYSVRELFAIFGFEVEHIHIAGRQIDLIATKNDTLSIEPEKWAIEITTEHIDVDKGSKDSQKLLLANKETGARMMLVSTSGFAGPQRDTLKRLNIVTRTYAELESHMLNLGRYASVVKNHLQAQHVVDIGFDARVYVEPFLKVQRSTDFNAPEELLDATKWVQQVVSAESGLAGALLGNLGTGKTTILQKAQLILLEKFLESPSDSPVPIYIPLARYKYHSGRVDSLLQEILAEAGLPNYPSLLIKHLAKHGRIVFFFDGLDEVHPVQSVEDIVKTVTTILDYLGKSVRAIISSRTHLFASTNEEMAIFGPYERQKITRAAASLNQLLAGHASTEIAYVQPFTSAQVNDYLRLACGPEYDKVKGQIETVYGFREMASTPVLLAMMKNTLPQLAHSGGLQTPFPQLELYKAYTNRWIQRDEGRAQLSASQRTHLSKVLAVDLIRRDEFAAPWEDIREILRQDPAWSNNPISEGAAELDVRNSTFLMREGRDHFRFVHRSIMEYFAALDSFEKLTAGHPAEERLSDGHAEFLTLETAEYWLANPSGLPFLKAEVTTDYWSDLELLALISAASLRLPKDASPKPVLKNLRVSGENLANWHLGYVHVENCTIKVTRVERLAFDACVFVGLRIFAQRVLALTFNACRFQSSSIELPLEAWRSVKLYPADDNAIQALGLPDGFEAASRWCENPRCTALVDKSEWKVPYRCLKLAAAVARRLAGKVKTNSENWATGQQAEQLKAVLPILESSGIIGRDASRSPHQLYLTPKGMGFFTGLKNEPMKYQSDLMLFDVDPRAD